MGSDVITGEWNYCYYLEFELDDPHKLAWLKHDINACQLNWTGTGALQNEPRSDQEIC